MEIKVGYKNTEIGLIPEDWECVSMGEVGNTVIGLTYSPSNVKDYGLLVLRSSNIQQNQLKYENNVFVDMDVPKRVIVKENDILICVRNGSKQLIGKCALINKNAQGYAFGAFMSIYRSKFSKFIFYSFQSNIIQKQIDETMGATINQITNKNLDEFKIALPQLSEQTAIATVLSDTDKLIQALEKKIAKKQLIKKGAMQKLLIPKEGWEVKVLGEICDVRDGTHDSPKYVDNGVKFVTSKNIINGKLDFTDLKYISSIDAYNIDKRSRVEKGDILMSMIGTIGNAVLIDFEPDFSIKNVALIKPKSRIIYPLYLIQLLYSDTYQEYISSKLDGGIQKFISLGVLRSLEVPFPNVETQVHIAQVLTDIDYEIETLQNKLAKYKQLKQGLMQNLLTGKIRLV